MYLGKGLYFNLLLKYTQFCNLSINNLNDTNTMKKTLLYWFNFKNCFQVNSAYM